MYLQCDTFTAYFFAEFRNHITRVVIKFVSINGYKAKEIAKATFILTFKSTLLC